MNGDESADLICVQPDGGVAIYQTHTSDAGISFGLQPYEDDLFGFCPVSQKLKPQVAILILPLFHTIKKGLHGNLKYWDSNSLQIFFGTFNDDDLGDMMCFPSGLNDSRSLVQGDAAATFLVSFPSGFNDSRSLAEGWAAATFPVVNFSLK